MPKNSSAREWSRIGKRVSTLSVDGYREEDVPGIVRDFWNLFIRDVIPKNTAKDWDYIHVVFRMASGTIEVWPQKLNEGASEAYWAVLYLIEIERLVREKLSEPEIDKKVPEFEMKYAKLLAKEAEAVDLDSRSGVAKDGLPMYFYSYEKQPEIWKTTIKN